MPHETYILKGALVGNSALFLLHSILLNPRLCMVFGIIQSYLTYTAPSRLRSNEVVVFIARPLYMVDMAKEYI